MNETKMLSTDRILILSRIDNKAPIAASGLIDQRLFTGETKLHAIKDVQTCLWYLKYDKGILPDPLKCRFTSFKALVKFASDYFLTRNVCIKEIID